MSKACGFPLGKFSWDPRPEGIISRSKPSPFLGRQEKGKIMRQLGAITSQLFTLRFDKIGSLLQVNGEYSINECLSPAFIWHERDSLGDELARGPFQDESSYYESLISALVLHVKELPLERNVFFAPIPEVKEYDTFPSYLAAVNRWNDFVTIGSKVDSSTNRLDYCIAGYMLRKMIPEINRKSANIPADLKDGFPLCHPDLSMNNVFIDDDFNITCIIDWIFSSTVPIATLLATPGMPHPRDEVDSTLIPFFRAGFTNQFFQGKDIILDTQFWESTRRSWLLTRLVTLNDLQDYRYFTELYALVFTPKEEVNIPKRFKELLKEDEFVKLAKTLAEDDLDEDKMKRDEEDYFRYKVSDEEAVARKLTMMAELSEGFAADRRLWRWIGDAMA